MIPVSLPVGWNISLIDRDPFVCHINSPFWKDYGDSIHIFTKSHFETLPKGLHRACWFCPKKSYEGNRQLFDFLGHEFHIGVVFHQSFLSSMCTNPAKLPMSLYDRFLLLPRLKCYLLKIFFFMFLLFSRMKFFPSDLKFMIFVE